MISHEYTNMVPLTLASRTAENSALASASGALSSAPPRMARSRFYNETDSSTIPDDGCINIRTTNVHGAPSLLRIPQRLTAMLSANSESRFAFVLDILI